MAQCRQLAGKMRENVDQVTLDLRPLGFDFLPCIRLAKRHDIARDRNSEVLPKIARRHEDQLHILALRSKHGQRDVALALGLPLTFQRGHASLRNQLAQTPVSRAILGIGEEGETFDRFYPAADKRLQLKSFRLAMDAHHTGHGIGIGNSDRIVTEPIGPLDQIDRIGRAAQEAEAGNEPQFDERRALRRPYEVGIDIDPALRDLVVVLRHTVTRPVPRAVPSLRQDRHRTGAPAPHARARLAAGDRKGAPSPTVRCRLPAQSVRRGPW